MIVTSSSVVIVSSSSNSRNSVMISIYHSNVIAIARPNMIILRCMIV